jgi:hypothetical protein
MAVHLRGIVGQWDLGIVGAEDPRIAHGGGQEPKSTVDAFEVPLLADAQASCGLWPSGRTRCRPEVRVPQSAGR